VVAVRRRQAGVVLFVATLLLLGGSALTGSVAAQTATAPDCSTVEYSQDANGNYEVETASELQCIGQGSTDTTLADDFVQIADIDVSETAEWNDGAGFIPIGAGTPFTGTFDGDGNDITGLTIDRESSVGLFGVLGPQGGVTDVSLVDVSVAGTDDVGAVAGRTEGTILRASVRGAVAGQARVGGVTGSNDGTIELSHATSEIGGQSQVGGLVGENNGTVRSTYAAGPVNGLEESGGLVGANTGVVEASYWDMEATGQEASAGGTGLTTAAMTGGNAPGSMEAFDFQTSWEVGASEEYPQLRPSASSDGPTLSDYRSVGDKSTLETLTMVDFALGGGSGVVMTIALYLLASRSRHGDMPVETGQTDDSAGDTDDTPEQTGAGASGQATSAGSGLDDRLDELKRKIQAARVPYEKEKYERALDLCDEAIFIAEDALDTAHAEAPARVDDVEALHDKATSLRETIWEEWREEQQQTTGGGAQILEEDWQTDGESGDQGTESQPRGENEPASQPGYGGDSPVEEDLVDDPGGSESIEWDEPDEESENIEWDEPDERSDDQ
jgi:hypothetical protein